MDCCLILYILATFLVKGLSLSNPCNQDGHRVFPNIEFGSRNERCSPKISPVCDYYLTEDWYVVENSTFLGKCPQSGNCGVSYPVWLNGTIPSEAEGEVNRTACIKQDGDCCKSYLTLIVKNCTSFLVYYLPALPTCPMAYCFESNLPCDFQSTTGTVTVQTDSSRTSVSLGVETTSTKSTPKDDRMMDEPLPITAYVVMILILIMPLSWVVAYRFGWKNGSKRFQSSNTDAKIPITSCMASREVPSGYLTVPADFCKTSNNGLDVKAYSSVTETKTQQENWTSTVTETDHVCNPKSCLIVVQSATDTSNDDQDEKSCSSVTETKTQKENWTSTVTETDHVCNPKPCGIMDQPAADTYTSGFTRVN